MINYFYTLQYPETYEEDFISDEDDTIVHARMYVIADKYDVPGLKDAAESALESLLEEVGAKNSPMCFIAELLQIVYEMTPTHDRTLRDILYEFIKTHMRKFQGRKTVQDYALANHDFGIDLLRTQLDVWKGNGQLWCRQCLSYKTFEKHCHRGHTLLDTISDQ
jgi:hypothetical protein